MEALAAIREDLIAPEDQFEDQWEALPSDEGEFNEAEAEARAKVNAGYYIGKFLQHLANSNPNPN